MTAHPSTAITTTFEGRLYHLDPSTGVHTAPMVVVMDSAATEIYTVDVRLTDASGQAPVVICAVGRDLLAGGLSTSSDTTAPDQPAAEVCVATRGLACGDWTLITWYSPGDRAEIGIPTYELIEFLAETEDLVAPGTESAHLELDSEIRELLKRETGR